MNVRKTVLGLTGALLLSGLAVAQGAVTAPAMAAETQTVVTNENVLQAESPRTYRQGYREGFRDGWRQAREECEYDYSRAYRGFRYDPDYERGYERGFRRGYDAGFREYCD